MTIITHLFIKVEHGLPVSPVSQLTINADKYIEGAISTPQLRQGLIINKGILDQFDIQPGQLKENIVIEGLDVHKLVSGTVLQLGDVQVRLNFHCETCSKIKDFVRPKILQHQRGVLCSFLNSGVIRLGSSVKVLGTLYEPIPYEIPDRIRWFFDRNSAPIESTKLISEIGLSPAYCRALPIYMKSVPEYREKVIYKSKVSKPTRG